jgi:OFA family oxalate/formate antiporter-like MFS transporter
MSAIAQPVGAFHVETASRGELPLRLPFWYGHLVLALCTLARLLKSFGQANTLFLSVPGILRDVHLTNTTLGLWFATACLAASVVQPLFGRLLDKHGGRVCIPVALVLLAASLLLLAVARNGVTVFISLLGLRAIGLGALDTFSSATVCRWYVAHRGSALALMTVLFYLGTGAGTVQLMAAVQKHGSWRAGPAVAALLCVCAAPVCGALIISTPEKAGLQPDGIVVASTSHDGATPEMRQAVADRVSLTRAQALRTRVFWVWSLYTLSFFFSASGTDFHLVSMTAEAGTVNVASTLSVATGASAGVASLLAGWLLDRGTPGAHLLVCGGICLSGYLFLLTVMVSPLIAWLTGIVKGTADACAGVALPYVFAEVFGRAHAGEIFALNRTLGVVGSGLGPLLFGVWRDVAGKYRPALLGVACMPLVASLAVALTPPHASCPAVSEEAPSG